MDVAKIEERVDRAVTAATEIDQKIGGIKFQNMGEVMEASKMMAVAGVAVPPHCRGAPGVCFAVCIQALEWGMSPFAVANKSYVVNNKGVERIAYESQLIHAVIEARAPLKARLRYEIIGEGDERKCKVWGTFKGETEPHVFTSSTLGEIVKERGRNEYGKVKGSPLWDSKPEVQLFYSSSRDWARMFCPDVILGVYSPDEFPDAEPVDVTPKSAEVSTLATRLKERRAIEHRQGFNADHVIRETDAAHRPVSTIDGDVNSDEAQAERENDKTENGGAPGGNDLDVRREGGSERVGDANDQGAGLDGNGATGQDVGPSAGDAGKGKEKGGGKDKARGK